MRIWVVLLCVLGIFFVGLKVLQAIKFDTVVSVSIAKGPFQGVSCNIIHYKVSYNDLQFKNDFWDSAIGKKLFGQLSLILQALIKTAHKYVSIELDINYLGLIKRHYKIAEVNGSFVLI